MADKTVNSTDDAFAWSIRRFAAVTQLDRTVVKARLAHINPCGKAKGYPVYKSWEGLRAIYEQAKPEVVTDPNKMAPRDRRDWYESEKIRLQVETESGLLITIDEHRDNLANTFKALAMIMDTVPDQLERKHALPANVIDDVQNTFDDFRQGMYDSLAKVS